MVDAQAGLVQAAMDALEPEVAPEPTPEPEPEPVPAVDLTALSNTMNEAWALNGPDYTPESWSNLQTALAVAYEVLTDTAATQQAADEQTALVRAAIDALQPAASEPEPEPTSEPAPDPAPEADPSPEAATDPQPGTDVAVDEPTDDAYESVPDTSTDGGEAADQGEAADSAEADEDVMRHEAAEYLGMLYVSALYQANLDDPEGTMVPFDQDGWADLLIEPTAWPALAGNIIAQAATNTAFADFLQAGLLDAANPLGLDLAVAEDGSSVSVPMATAGALLTGVTGEASGDPSYVAATNLTLADDLSAFYVVPVQDYTVNADCVDLQLWDDGTLEYALKLTFTLADGTHIDRYYQLAAMPSDESPFGWNLVRLVCDSSLSGYFEQ